MSDAAPLRRPKPQYRGRNGFSEDLSPVYTDEFNGAALHEECQRRRLMEWTLEFKGSSIPSSVKLSCCLLAVKADSSTQFIGYEKV